MPYIAHRTDDNKEQLLLEHLCETARIAADMAKIIRKNNLAYLCGLLHDVGKYSKEFQDRIKNNGSICDHSTAGAQVLEKINEPLGKLLGYIITGHHSGLLNGGGWGDTCNDKSLYARLKKEVPYYGDFSKEIGPDMYPSMNIMIKEIADTKPLDALDLGYCLSFLIRMLFSCLVDADYLDTERFMKNGTVKRGVECNFVNLEDKIVRYANSFVVDSFIKEKRKQIFEECLNKAQGKPGIYTLTVPTGGGKTISSMAFALRHINSNQQNYIRRVIYVIPFTSIIEQNAKVFSDIFGENLVLEHHSNFDFDDSNDNDINIKKLATENWDMPIIVTTNVQFFESIYGNKSSKLRKLHNIANSVIVFDEVQMLPTDYLLPCVKAMEELVHNYNCTIVLCSATQPELERFIPKKVICGEICGNIKELYNSFNRTKIQFIGTIKVDELLSRITVEHQCLIIVNTKKQANKLFERLTKESKEGFYYLSTYMCPAHRLDVIGEIKRKLKDGEKCIVVSTTLIEAGVDVDFPVVYRVMCGLDSIIQSAGRCNRERKYDVAYVFVFDFEENDYKLNSKSAYANYLNQRRSITEIVASKYNDVSSPEAIKEYFDILFTNMDGSELDKKSIIKRLNKGYNLSMPKDFIFDFEDIADDFKIIDNNTYSVIVKYDQNAIKIIHELEYVAFNKDLLRKLQKYAVNLYKHEYIKLKQINAVKDYGENISILINPEDYSKETGIIIIDELGIAEFI